MPSCQRDSCCFFLVAAFLAVVLVAVGRRPFTEGLGAREVGVAFDERGRITVNERFETSVAGIFAIGDVIPGPMLAHKAEEEGVAAVEMMAGQYGHVNYDAIPNVVYTAPELASVGVSDEDASKRGLETRIGAFPFTASARAKCLGETDGAVKVIADAKTDRLLGVHVLGPRASDLIASVPERHTGRLRSGMHGFPLPVGVPEITVSMLWHPRLDADPAHRWLRGCVREVCTGQRAG